MEQTVRRVLLAGTSSGCGKTTVVCALLQALVDRGLRVGAFKCGPDYIDPMFHSRIIGARSGNLDGFFFSENTMRLLLAKNSADRDISVIEGVMGYYDGAGLTSTAASSWETARTLDAPAVLVADAKGAALSVLAVVQGFLDFQEDSRIRGVLFNRCSGGTYPALAAAVEARFGGKVRALGYLPELPACRLESRHLGLVTAGEVADLREKLALLGEPELPPALSAAALFQRMEEGSLSLPEEDPLEATAAAGKAPAGESPSQGGKVISWKKVLRRGIPLAACLALVIAAVPAHRYLKWQRVLWGFRHDVAAGSMEPHSYVQIPKNIAEKIVAERGRNQD